MLKLALSKNYCMEDKLKLFHEDIDSIFEMIKEKFNYNDFTVTCKNSFDKRLNAMSNGAKKDIEPYIYNTELAVQLLSVIQEKTEEVMFFLKQTDENFKTQIYKMSSSLQIDSHLAYDFDDETWIELNRFE